MRLLFGLITIFIALLLARCSEKEECVFVPDTSNINIELDFQSLSDSFVRVASREELVSLLTRHEIIRDEFFRRREYPNDSVFVNELYRRFTNPHIDTLLLEVRRVFADEASLKNEFIKAFENLMYYYPDIRIPKIQTVVTGLDNDLFVSDSLIIVGLDYYLGPGAKYRPNMYEYLLRQYEKENIVPSCMLIYGINAKFNQTDLNDKTVLADMIAYGKSFYFAKQMLPCTPDSTFIWYTSEEMEGARKNQDMIWYRLIEDQVLYATSHVTKQKYLGDRPKTLEVGDKCPGRIGQWVGWEIVKAYMKAHPEVSLTQLMASGNANEIFRESKYKPERR
jgi:hypothetical protein